MRIWRFPWMPRYRGSGEIANDGVALEAADSGAGGSVEGYCQRRTSQVNGV